MRPPRRPRAFLPVLALMTLAATAAAGQQPPPRKPAQKAASKTAVRLITMRTITEEALAGGRFGEIVDLALDKQRTLYVCDARSGNVRKFDDFGTLLGTIGKKGPGPGEFERPGEIEVAGDRLFVRDLGRPSISVFDLDGKYLSSARVDETEGRWKKFRALPDGRFVVEVEFADPAAPDAVPETRLCLHGPDFARLKTLYSKAVRRSRPAAGPVRMSVPLPFAPSVEWDVTPEGMLVAGYSGDYEIEYIDPDKGRVHSWKRKILPVSVTEKDREEFLAGLSLAGLGSATELAKTVEFPREKPAFERLMVNGRGLIWAFIRPPVPTAGPVFEAFDQDGSFRSRVICEGFWPLSAPAVFFVGGVWIAAPGPDGKTALIRYQIAN